MLGAFEPVPCRAMFEPDPSTEPQEGEKGLQPLNPRAVLLVEKSEYEDALRAQEVPQRRRTLVGMATLMAGLLATIVGFLLGEQGWIWIGSAFFSVPILGLGWYLMADMEIRRLGREVERLEGEIQAMEDSGVERDREE